jgi:hypothetical protein
MIHPCNSSAGKSHELKTVGKNGFNFGRSLISHVPKARSLRKLFGILTK